MIKGAAASRSPIPLVPHPSAPVPRLTPRLTPLLSSPSFLLVRVFGPLKMVAFGPAYEELVVTRTDLVIATIVSALV